MSHDRRDKGTDLEGSGGASFDSGRRRGNDALAEGHAAVRLLEGGGLGMPRISVMAQAALDSGEFGPARHASTTWHINKPYLEALARSLDPTDDLVGRAQALLKEMESLESRLPDLFELGFRGAESAQGRAHWLARLGRAAQREADAAARDAAAAEVRSPLRPENIKPDGVGWSGCAVGLSARVQRRSHTNCADCSALIVRPGHGADGPTGSAGAQRPQRRRDAVSRAPTGPRFTGAM
jgi:hypothetical protein